MQPLLAAATGIAVRMVCTNSVRSYVSLTLSLAGNVRLHFAVEVDHGQLAGYEATDQHTHSDMRSL